MVARAALVDAGVDVLVATTVVGGTVGGSVSPGGAVGGTVTAGRSLPASRMLRPFEHEAPSADTTTRARWTTLKPTDVSVLASMMGTRTAHTTAPSAVGNTALAGTTSTALTGAP